MGKRKYLEKLLELARKNDDRIAKEVSKRSSKLDEEQVKNGIDTVSDAVEKKST